MNRLEELLQEGELVAFRGYRKGGVYRIALHGVATNYVIVESEATGATLGEATRKAAERLVMLVSAPPRMDIVRCKGCVDHVVWANTPTGKPMPVNVVPGPGGNIELVRSHRGSMFARVLSEEEARSRGRALFKSHFATCPSAGVFRRERAS